MSKCDLDFDEARGGPAQQQNYLSIPEQGPVHMAMRRVLPFESAGARDVGRVLVPSIFVENLFAKAPVTNPPDLAGMHGLTRCMSSDFLGNALDLLIENLTS